MPHKVDESKPYYLHNWHAEMGLVCTSKAVIGLMVSAYFVGYALGGLAYALPDRIGRKRSVMFGMLLSCFAQTVMILTNSFGMRTFMFFLMGVA